MNEQELLTTIDGPIARMTFNRPQVRNALTAGMLSSMTAFLEIIEDDPAVRCLIMSGAGEHFMAGGDVGGFNAALESPLQDRQAEFARRAESALPVFAAIERCSKPIIAKVRGAAAGASVSWVATADFVLVSETAQFVFAHIHLGLSPDAGLSFFLPRVIGLRKAKELILLGGRLDAEQAVSAGLANRLVPDAELDSETEKLALRLARGPHVAIRYSKCLLNKSLVNSQAVQMKLEADAFGVCAATHDFSEGVRAFTGKRKAVFEGR